MVIFEQKVKFVSHSPSDLVTTNGSIANFSISDYSDGSSGFCQTWVRSKIVLC